MLLKKIGSQNMQKFSINTYMLKKRLILLDYDGHWPFQKRPEDAFSYSTIADTLQKLAADP